MRSPFPIGIGRVLYVIMMGWHRWGPTARRKWVVELLLAADDVREQCVEWLEENP